jgi:hypothetical protein
MHVFSSSSQISHQMILAKQAKSEELIAQRQDFMANVYTYVILWVLFVPFML